MNFVLNTARSMGCEKVGLTVNKYNHNSIKAYERIGFIKDISAGAVTFAAITAIITGFIIYLPKFL